MRWDVLENVDDYELALEYVRHLGRFGAVPLPAAMPPEEFRHPDGERHIDGTGDVDESNPAVPLI